MNVGYMPPSKTVEWETPIDFYNALDNEFNFNLDPCAADDNHKCNKYFTKADNGLLKSWGGYRVYCNPPYGRELTAWVEKAYNEAHKNNTLIVMLLPARTDIK